MAGGSVVITRGLNYSTGEGGAPVGDVPRVGVAVDHRLDLAIGDNRSIIPHACNRMSASH